MRNPLSRIWIHFGTYMTMTALVTVSVLAVSLLLREHYQFDAFLNNLPAEKYIEMTQLIDAGEEYGPRAKQIYDQYWKIGPDEDETFLLISDLFISLLVGLFSAFLLARNFARPVVSVAEAAFQISQGDFSVRAKSYKRDGELADMVSNFNRMADALELLQNERKATSAAISHELRTPLTIMQGRLHALSDGVITAGPNEYKRLLEQTEHLVRLVEDVHVLELSGVDQLALHRTELDLSLLIQDTLLIYDDRIRSHGMTATFTAKHLMVYADSARIRQILANLIENALRYASTGKVLDILMNEDKGMVIVDFSDRGPGLPHGMNERIFDPFFRLDHSRSRATGGSGLGLSVVRSLIRQHEGSIRVFNRVGGGATFRMVLPIRGQMPSLNVISRT